MVSSSAEAEIMGDLQIMRMKEQRQKQKETGINLRPLMTLLVRFAFKRFCQCISSGANSIEIPRVPDQSICDIWISIKANSTISAP